MHGYIDVGKQKAVVKQIQNIFVINLTYLGAIRFPGFQDHLTRDLEVVIYLLYIYL